MQTSSVIPRPVRPMLVGALAAYVLVLSLGGGGAALAHVWGCTGDQNDPMAQMACGLAMVGGGSIGLVVAAIALVLIGLKLKLRGWWVPALLGLALAIVLLGSGLGSNWIWLLLVVPVAASWASAPVGTPVTAKRLMGVITAAVLVLAIGISVVGGFQGRAAEVDKMVASGAPLYAPPEQTKLRLTKPSATQRSVIYNIYDGDTFRGHLVADASPRTCVARNGVQCLQQGDGVTVLSDRYGVQVIREVPGGHLLFHNSTWTQAEQVAFVKSLQPVDAEALAKRAR